MTKVISRMVWSFRAWRKSFPEWFGVSALGESYFPNGLAFPRMAKVVSRMVWSSRAWRNSFPEWFGVSAHGENHFPNGLEFPRMAKVISRKVWHFRGCWKSFPERFGIYFSTVIDDYSRYIIHWELCSSMTSEYVSRTIVKAVEKAGVTLRNPPCLLSDNGPCYIASSLKEYLCKDYNIKHIHGKPLHLQTQGKIERYHWLMKNVIKLNHYCCPSELEKAIDGWVKYYNERRFHESLDNLTPRDVYLGQGEKIKKIREIIKQNSINKRIFDNKTMKYLSK